MTKPRTIYCTAVVCALCVGFLPAAAYALSESTAEEGSNAQAVCALGETGQGVTVGIMGGFNVYFQHEAFDGVDISNYDATGLGIEPHWHDTFMAGIIVSQGSTAHPAYAEDIGVAPGVSVRSMRIGTTSSIEEGLRELINNQGARVIVNGYQASSAIPDGNNFITLLYDYYAYAENVIFAHAAGNKDPCYPDLTTVSVPGDAYNGITTAGLILNDPADEYVYRRVGSKSLPGPTIDVRRKPDIAAPSDSQDVPTTGGNTAWTNTHGYSGSAGATSYSGPHTAGVAALLLGFADSSGEVYDDDRHEVIKAVIVNSAFPNIDDRSGNPTNPIDPNNTWHVDRGYGRIDALRAYETLAAGSIIKDTTVTSDKGWAYDSIDIGSEHTYIVNAPKNSRLRITLTWDRKIVWQDKFPKRQIDNGELTAHFANLDLEVYEPNEPGNAIFGGLDTNDNLEKCDLLLAASGNYVLKVVSRPANEFSVNYVLAFELVAPIPGDFDLNYIVNYDDLAVLMQEWLGPEPDPKADLWPDGKVDLLDVAVFGQNWRKVNPAYYQQ